MKSIFEILKINKQTDKSIAKNSKPFNSDINFHGIKIPYIKYKDFISEYIQKSDTLKLILKDYTGTITIRKDENFNNIFNVKFNINDKFIERTIFSLNVKNSSKIKAVNNLIDLAQQLYTGDASHIIETGEKGTFKLALFLRLSKNLKNIIKNRISDKNEIIQALFDKVDFDNLYEKGNITDFIKNEKKLMGGNQKQMIYSGALLKKEKDGVEVVVPLAAVDHGDKKFKNDKELLDFLIKKKSILLPLIHIYSADCNN